MPIILRGAPYFLFAFLIAVATPQAVNAGAYCPNPAHARPAPVPDDLTAPVAKAFGIDASALKDAAYVRCVGPKLMGCYVGANLDCDKADTRRSLPGATAWCKQNPGSDSIPMVATGHDTIYSWSCKGTHAVPGKPTVKVDRNGYVADNWKPIP